MPANFFHGGREIRIQNCSGSLGRREFQVIGLSHAQQIESEDHVGVGDHLRGVDLEVVAERLAVGRLMLMANFSSVER